MYCSVVELCTLADSNHNVPCESGIQYPSLVAMQNRPNKGSAFPMGSADTANDDGRRGSNVYEVNHWLWMFGRGKPRLGGLSVAETAVRKSAGHEEHVKRAVETRRRRKAAKASSK